MRKIKLSICVPCYNNAPFIAQALSSAITENEIYDVEVVVVDDCSHDGSWEVIQTFEPYVIASRNPRNLGMTENWNRCIELSSGDFIVVMGGDDIVSPKSFSACIEMLMRGPDISLCAITRNVIDEKGKILLRGNNNGAIKIKAGREYIALSILLGKNVIGEPLVCIFRREDYYSVGGFTAINNYTADLCMWLKFAKVGKIAKLNTIGANFRISGQSNGSKTGFKQITEFYDFINYAKAEIGISFFIALAGKITSIFCFMARQLFFALVKIRE